MYYRKVFLVVCFIVSCTFIDAQSDSAFYHIKSTLSGITTNGKLNALYSYSNTYGIYDPIYLAQSLLHL